jgi:hypothetical protein
MCPLKDPTYIINKKVKENIMQHNNLYGKVNKQYHKDIDLPTTNTKPTKATIPTVANSTHTTSISPSATTTDFFDPYAPITPPLEDPHLPYDLSNHPSSSETESSNDIIQTETFDVPIPPITNYCTKGPTDTSQTSPFIDLIFDPTDYLHFSS